MRTAVFIPVRTASTRLPGKCLLEVNGKAIIEYLIERVKWAKKPDLIVLCTTTNPEDEVLASIAVSNGIEFFQGSEKDILERFLAAANAFKVDFIVSAEGDDIFIDAKHIDMMLDVFNDTDADYITYEGLPLGAAPCGIKVAALQKVCQLKDESDTETGWKMYFTDSGLFYVSTIKAGADLNNPDARMTLDYPEDFQFFREVIERLYVPGKMFGLREILNLLKKEPDLIKINSHWQQKYWETYYQKANKIKWKKAKAK